MPDVPEDEAQAGDAESVAVAAHPAFQQMLAEQRRRRAAGERGIPSEEVYRELGLAPAEAAREEREYSGRITVRLPKSLHRRLAEEAEREGVSINELVLTYLAQCVAAGPQHSGVACGAAGAE